MTSTLPTGDGSGSPDDPAATQARLIVAAREGERRRLAAELHDQAGANLAAIKLNLDSLSKAVARELGESELPATLLQQSREMLDDTIRSIRDLCGEWRPARLEYAGLTDAIEASAARFNRRTGIDVHLDLGDYDATSPPEVELMLLRIVQEALHNCGRHALASRVALSIRRDLHGRSLTVEDDGVGFDQSEIGAGNADPGLGLLIMRERAQAVGAAFTLHAIPGKGTRIVVHF